MIDCSTGRVQHNRPPHGAWVEFASVKTSRARTDQQQQSLSNQLLTPLPMHACMNLQYALSPAAGLQRVLQNFRLLQAIHAEDPI